MDDPRFKHVASDPRFKAIPKRSRKVTIDSRFQSMFTEKRFKVKYTVDKRGRRVQQSSSEDLRKYYELEGGGEEEREKKPTVELEAKKGKGRLEIDEELSSADSVVSEASDDSPEEDEEAGSSDGEAESSDGDEGSLCDLYMPSSDVQGGWREEEGEGDNVPLSDETSHRIAVCNMDWDHVGATDIFVLFNSFKPAGASVRSVMVYPSDFGLERMSQEDIQGPVGLGGGADMSCDQSEGVEYSEEKLRQYQLSRFKYYYAVVECDSVATAEHIYKQCNGLEYEHSGGQLDLRFIPDDMTFDDREAKSTAREDAIQTGFVPTDFVSSALQQSKVKLQWDETDPHRLQVTQRKFTKDDIQSMNFSAYLASSSGSEGEEEREGDGGEKAVCYKNLLEGQDGGADSASEVMEITWEPGLVESAEKIVKKKKKGTERVTPWEQYLQKKKEKRREAKRKTKQKVPAEDVSGEGETSQASAGFEDPFFHHSVTTATAGTTKNKKGKRKRMLDEAEVQERDELELLVMSDGEGEKTKEHFSLKKIMRAEKAKKRKKAKEEEDLPVDDFKVDVADPRFEALYDSHLYAPDPSAPQYRATKGMVQIMEERQRRGRKRGVASTTPQGKGEGQERVLEHDPATGQPLVQPSLSSLVMSVKSKAKSFKDRKKKALPKH